MNRLARRILWRPLVGCVLLLVVGGLLAEALKIRWLVAGSRAELLVFHHFEHSQEPVDAAFFGSSSTRHAIVPGALEPPLEAALGRPVRVWNLALQGGTPRPAPVIIEELFTTERRPRVFFLEVNPGYWNETRDDATTDVYWRWFASPVDVLSSIGRASKRSTFAGFRGFARGVEALWRAPTFLYSRRAKNDYARVLDRRGGTHALQEVQRATANDPLRERSGTRRRAELGGRLRYSELRSKVLHETARLAQERGIRLVLLNLPVQAKTMEHLREEEYNSFIDWMRAEAETLGVTFLDLNHDAYRAQEEGGWDGFIHFTPYGARQFGEKFGQEFLLPMLQDAEGAG